MSTSPLTLKTMLGDMIRIRVLEERCAELYGQMKIRGFLHLAIGEEAIAAGTIPQLGPDDAVLGTYREHGHALMRGVSAASIMSEMFGKADGCSGGRGGSMHLFDAERRFYGGNAIVGGHLPLATGLALADKLSGRRTDTGAVPVTACFFGEGAMAEGEFHEAMNLAALWDLPVLFCCENNRYAMGTSLETSESQTDLALKASAYQMPAWSIDGMDAAKTAAGFADALATVRGGGGPVFLEFLTYRFRAHSMFDPDRYRDPDEVAAWKEKDPILTATEALLADGTLDDDAVTALWQAANDEVDAAVAHAEAAPDESIDTLTRHVYAEPNNGEAVAMDLTAADADGASMSYREAMAAAISEALREDPRVFIMGEDVADYGGTYAVTMGMVEEFGAERVRNTPLSESGFVGAGLGAALGGMAPIVEIMTVNFSLLALDQIVNTAATFRHMSGGQLGVPVVIRMTTGAGRQLAAQHSHSLEGWYAHVPGLKVVAPATVADARWMLSAALADPDPVIIFEHSTLYNLTGPCPASPVPLNEGEPAPNRLDRAAIRRAGSDCTLVASGGTVPKALEAADQLELEGIAAEVIDLRSLRPIDWPTIVESVARTHRAVVVDEGWRTGGLSAELASGIAERAFFALDAPVGRVAGVEVPIPYARHLEDASIPQVADIAAAVRRLVAATAPKPVSADA